MFTRLTGLAVSDVMPPPLSRVLVELAATSGARVSLNELVTTLSNRGFAPLIILLAAPNLLPLPPGSSTVFGIPLILIASQLLIARPRVWLPRLVRERSLDRATFRKIATRLEPLLQRFEKLAKPRCWPMPQTAAERLAGLVVLAMALVLIAPIPFREWNACIRDHLCVPGPDAAGWPLAGRRHAACRRFPRPGGRHFRCNRIRCLGLTKVTSLPLVPTTVDPNDALIYPAKQRKILLTCSSKWLLPMLGALPGIRRVAYRAFLRRRAMRRWAPRLRRLYEAARASPIRR
jgi:Exopolysaccharide synthesis, ExoD